MGTRVSEMYSRPKSSPFLVSPLSLGAEAPLQCGSKGAAWAGRICFSRLIKTELTGRN